LYGSVSKEDIQTSFKDEGLDIQLETLHIDEPIKKLGIYHISVVLHPEVKFKVKIWVVRK